MRKGIKAQLPCCLSPAKQLEIALEPEATVIGAGNGCWGAAYGSSCPTSRNSASCSSGLRLLNFSRIASVSMAS